MRRRSSADQGVARVLVIGGTSEIALATVRRMAQLRPVAATLLGRDGPGLERAAGELRAAGVGPVEVAIVDAAEPDTHESVLREAFAAAREGFDVALLAVGRLGAQAGLDAEHAEALEVMRTTFLGAGSLLICALRELRAQGRGTLVVLSSVAGELPRASNAVYCAAKAGLDSLAQALGDSVASTGVRVLVVRPGFVRTRMTTGLPALPLAVGPDAVARAIARALTDGRGGTIWVPGVLRYLLLVLRHLPRTLRRRLAL
ncbi:MAG TPA: SDR family NAD(P)-dependent oxidoreductase [Solirubrobacteraceae bacterium]|nr:SDR family NAD(P)-dependent oxidoreductase [Solirubrobacteraceae bacterium]